MTHAKRAREVFDIELAAIKAVRARLDNSFDIAVDLLLQSIRERRKVVVLGIGKSGNIGRKIAATLSSTGTAAVVLDPVDALHGDLGVVNDGDLVCALSYSGESDELSVLILALKRFSVRIIAFTGAPKSFLARHADAVLDVRVPKEACPHNLAPTSSTTAMLVMGDALAMSVMRARDFKPRDFALRHPAGAIGRALLLKIEDIMRRGNRSAVAPESLSVKEAILVMTQAKSGSVSVVNTRGKLVGVFTDGDLRRRMAEDADILSRPLKQVMTRSPICVRSDALAVEALRIFNSRNIDDLIVVNEKHMPVGMVDTQDLPKFKLL